VAFVLLFVAESVLLGLTGRASGEGGEEPEQSDPGPPEGTAAPGPGLLALGSASAPMKGLLCVLAASAALSLYLSWPRETTPASEHLAAFPLEVGEWRGVDAPLSEREYRVLGTRNVLSRRYQDSHGNQVQFVAVVAQQMRRRTHPPEQCLTGGGYSITGTEERAVAFSTDGSERAIGVQELLMRRSVQTKVVWYFFKSGDEVHTSYWLHQAGVALRKLRDRGAADVLVRFDTAAPMGEEDGARTVLSEFAREVLPVVMAELP
ncbi:MAG: EpsI family protein, partial [Candidatus Brocadiaceae bacterium]|jgi:EpsI family protein